MSSKTSNAPDQDPHSFPDQSMDPSTKQAVLLRAVIESLMDGVLVVSAKGEIVQCNNRGRQICKRLRRQSDSNVEIEWYSGEGTPTIDRKNVSPKQDRKKTALDKVETLAEWKFVPSTIWTVCQTLLDCQHEFPDLLLVPEQQLTLLQSSTQDDLRLRIRAQWLTLSPEIVPPTNTPPANVSPANHVESSQPLPYILVTLEDRDQSIQHLATTDKKRYRLTPRETEIWQMRLQGQSYRDIANDLVISQNTVKKHLKNIAAKRRDVLKDAG